MSFSVSHINLSAVTADQNAVIAADTGLVFFGFSAHESAGIGAAAHFHIVDGATVAGGIEMLSIRLAANANEHFWVGDRGIATPNGISIDMVSGEIDICIYYKIFD